MYQALNKKFSDGILRLTSGRGALWLVGGWSVAEATFWFIAPDFILGLLVAFAPTRWKRFLGVALIGSVIGGAISFILNTLYPEWMVDILSGTPFVQTSMILFVNDVYTKHHQMGVLFQAFSFIQFKVWTQLAVQHGFNPFIYFSLVMVSRAIRFGASSLLAKFVGSRITNFLRTHAIVFTVVYTALFIGLLFLVEGKG